VSLKEKIVGCTISVPGFAYPFSDLLLSSASSTLKVAFFLLAKFTSKRFWSFSVTRSEENNNNSNLQIRTFSFLLCSQNIVGWLKIFIVFLAYSHTWLNLLRDDGHFFYVFLPMVASLTINKTPWKKHCSEDECESLLLHHSWGVSCKQKVKLLSMISWANLLSLLWQTWLSVQYNYIVEEKKLGSSSPVLRRSTSFKFDINQMN